MQVAISIFAKPSKQSRQALAGNEPRGMVKVASNPRSARLFPENCRYQIDTEHMDVPLVRDDQAGFEVVEHADRRVNATTAYPSLFECFAFGCLERSLASLNRTFWNSPTVVTASSNQQDLGDIAVDTTTQGR
jgi:hypothetical protein